MKKIGIITIIDNDNYGNRLQNYAVQETLKKFNKFEIETIKNDPRLNKEVSKLKYFLKWIKNILVKIKNMINRSLRKEKFIEFNRENIKFSQKRFNVFKKYNDYEYLIVGSDQVWNPFFYRLNDFELLNFATTAKKISFSASFGVSKLPEEYQEKTRKALSDFKKISVREDDGKEIIKKLGIKKQVEVLIDPTMMLTIEEWDKISRKPTQLKSKKYILNYFLGEMSEERKKEINRIAAKNECEVINILDKDSSFYQTGPSEFLFLEKHAFLVCTDSFHASVFAFLYDRPFLIFDREDKHISMNSRLETLIKKFQLKNRKFKGKITDENLNHNYTKAYQILEEERKKANDFLKKILN